MAGLSRRTLLFGAGVATGAVGARLATSRAPVYDGLTPYTPAGGDGTLNDASLLSETPIHSHVTVSQDPGDALVDAIRAEIRAAAEDGRPFNIGAARHSMGGQAIPRDGHAVTFDSAFLEPDTAAGTYRVHAGTRWSGVIRALDPLGLSPAVMQSNNDFGVAATYSVNAHGWPVPYGPMGATVRSATMVLADGSVVTASRTGNPDLFNAAMGGYGLIGAITELDVDAVPNQRLEPSFEMMPAEEFSSRFREIVDDPDVNMAYGRLNVDKANFFREALLVSYRPAADQSDLPAASGSGMMAHLAGYIYRAQLGREPMKRVRWGFETGVGPRLGDGPVTRNSLINEPVVTLDDRDPTRTDILHEYFVGFDRFGEFLTACREVIPASYQEFLNVTLRFVDTDAESLLSYAPVPQIAAVMSFSQEMTARAEADMERMTRELVGRITEIGGSYYLPYRPHPTPQQFRRTYPGHAEFAALKRELDPGLTFRNALWDNYLARA